MKNRLSGFWIFFLFCCIASPIRPLLAQSRGDGIAEPYKSITVRVTGPKGEGFGFIVGERNDSVFIVTAKHVIEQNPGETKPVNVYFFNRFWSVQVDDIRRDQHLDMALLRVRKKDYMVHNNGPFCTRYQRSDPVWWVGQDREWKIPLDNVAGRLAVSEPDTSDRIEFNAIGIETGVSGAPLISEDGIVGMVIEDEPPTAYALDIEKIRRFAKSKAMWDLRECGASGDEKPTTPVAVPRKPTSCWDGWKQKKVCRDKLSDGSQGPEMVLLSGDRFKMGSESKEADTDEKPVRYVNVEPFAIARYEVTVAEFQRFAGAESYRTDAEKQGGCYTWIGTEWKLKEGGTFRNPGFDQQSNHPVACVSWNDATAYAKWLSLETGQRYRLPTEAEWEYAARAGSSDERFWGNNADEACRYANVADLSGKRQFSNWTIHDCDDKYVYTAPVGKYDPNRFGLYDMLGNVWEWTCSLYENPYGSEMNDCGSGNDRRALRGGAWYDKPLWVRSANRLRFAPVNRLNIVGFRVARIQ